MITSILFNFIYLLFPISIYFIYLVYSKVTFAKEKKIFFDLSLLSSFYLCTRYGDLKYMIFFIINILLLLCINKRRQVASFLLSLAICFYSSNIFSINIIYFFIVYGLILLVDFIFEIKSNIIIFLIEVQVSILLYIFGNYNLEFNLLFLIVSIVMIYIHYLIIKLITSCENMVKFYYSIEELTKEKELFQSLFKITHEIKNPLAVCKGYLEMFDPNDVKKSKRYIRIIDQEIDRTLILLKDFSDITKISLTKEMIDVDMLLEDVCDEVALIFRKNVKFYTDMQLGEEEIYGDYNRLKQVLINVIKNAKESIIGDGAVWLKASSNKNFVNIIIKDNGVGINKENLKNIGKPFFTTKKNGTGLGVFLSREIINKHEGSIKYQSSNKGTIVRISIPLKKINNVY